MRIKAPQISVAVLAVACLALFATRSDAVFFDLRGRTPSPSYDYTMSAGGITVRVGGSGFLLTSGATTFGIDSNGANDNPALIDGGNGSPESFAFLFGQDVFFESILISQFDAADAGTFNIKGSTTTSLANGVNVIGNIAEWSSAHFLRWTGVNAPGAGRGFSVDGFSVRLTGTVPAVAGDYSNNGVVDAADYAVWKKTLGNSITPFAGADGDGDGTINAGDYAEWRENFGRGSSSGLGEAAIPEASSLILFAIGTALCAVSPRKPRQASTNAVPMSAAQSLAV